MITWLGRPKWLGQEEPKSPEDAAADAAYNEALKADWPPKRDDVQNIGKAAGSAAGDATCVALAAETGGVTAIASALGICSDIGEAIGKYLGGAIYDIFEGFFAGEQFVAPQYDHVFYQRTRKAAIRLASQRLGVRTPPNEEILVETKALERWGVPGATLAAGRGPTEAERGPWRPYFSEDGLDTYLKKLATAESARVSEIIAQQKLPPSSKKTSALPVVIVAAVAVGVAWLLLAA